MAEADWLECGDVRPMLVFLRGKVSVRKLRLFACACVRRVWRFLDADESRRAIEVAERFADGLTSENERAEAEELAGSHFGPDACVIGTARDTVASWGDRDPTDGAWLSARGALDTIYHHRKWGDPRSAGSDDTAEAEFQAALLRDIAGNPFRPIVVDPMWLLWNDGVVRKLAQGISEERDLPAGTLDGDRFEILADALEDAGCDNPDILAHCRGPGPHVRGCWVVDLILGKS